MFRTRVFCLINLLLLVGCSSRRQVFTAPLPAMHGKVRGGQQPISGATIQLYVAGTEGDGSSSFPLLNPAPQTDANGNFSITGEYTCPSPGSLVYVVGTGGNPGLQAGTNNVAISLMAFLGPCGNLSASTFINVDEVTTVTGAFSLAPFAFSLSAIGSSLQDLENVNAASMAANSLADFASGSAPGGNPPAGTTVPVARINTLANIISSCVNSAGGTAGDQTSCGNLFALTTLPGAPPATDTLAALFDLAFIPTQNTVSLFNLVTPAAPFQPSLSSAPSDFDLRLQVNSGLVPSTPAIYFGNVVGGVPSPLNTVTLTNNTQSPIQISTVSIGGIYNAYFSQVNNCPATLTSLASCTVQISLDAYYPGLVHATLSIANSTANSTLAVDLYGNAESTPALQLLSVAPASIPAGTNGATVTLTGTGFNSSSSVVVDGIFTPARFISTQSLSFQLSGQYTYFAGSVSLAVSNGYGQSNTLQLPIVVPQPTLTSISPTSVTAGLANFSLTVTGTSITQSSSIVVNGVSYPANSYDGVTATVYPDPSLIATVGDLPITIDTPGVGSSNVLQLHVFGTANRVRTVNLASNDVASDPVHHLIYASIGSSSVTSPNSVVAIDPVTAAVVTTQALSDQPVQLAMSDDASFLYVSLPASGLVTRLSLPTLAPDISFSLGTDGQGNKYAADDLKVAPGFPHTVAATRTLPGFGSGAFGGLVVYDDGVARTGTTLQTGDAIAWGADAGTLYSTLGDNEKVYAVTPGGVNLATSLSALFGNFVSQLIFDRTTGRLYDDYGYVVDAATGNAIDQITVQNGGNARLAIDPSSAKAYLLGSSSLNTGEDIQSFDLDHFRFIDSETVPALSGNRIVRWGQSGLAIGGGNQIFLFDGPFVGGSGPSSPTGGYVVGAPVLSSLSPQSILVGSGDTSVTLTGQNFTPAEQVTWQGQSVSSVFVSATQIVATLPAALLVQSQTASFFISNGQGTESSNGLPFAVLPDGGPGTQIATMDVSGRDMVWDPTRSVLYVAVTNSSAPNGNSIAVIDPAAAMIKNVVYVGGQPSSLGISDDNSFLYVGLQTDPSVKRLQLPDLSLNLSIPLAPVQPDLGFATDVKAAPGHPNTVAVAIAGDLLIFDDAARRPNSLPSSSPGAYTVAWGNDATRLYANTFPEFEGFSALAVDGNGISSRIAGATGTDIGLRPHYNSATNLVYEDGGRITHPADATAAGEFIGSTLMVPDAQLNRAFVLENHNSGYEIDIFDLQRQTLLKTIPVPTLPGNPSQLVRWGSQGLAILTASTLAGQGILYLVQGSDISGLSTPPAGAITLSPVRVVEGTPAGSTITVTGVGFQTASTVQVNGAGRVTTFINASTLTFQLTQADLSQAGFLGIVVTGTTTGIATPAASLEVDNPIPTIAGILPANLPAGSSDTTAAISGTGFVPATIVQVQGAARSTQYVSSTQINVVLPSSDLAAAGTLSLTALNPTPGGGMSVAAPLAVINPAPVILGLSPAVIAAGSPGQQVSVYGYGFVSETTLLINGVARSSTFVTSGQLNISLTTADLAAPGNLVFVATNPAPSGGSSAPEILQVNTGVPGSITLSPALVVQGGATPAVIHVTGTNFMAGTVVALGNTYRATTVLSSTSLTFLLTVADQANLGRLYFFVFNPPPGGGASPSSILTIVSSGSTPVVTSVSPVQFIVGSSGNNIQVQGSGFTAGSVILWNGTSLAGTSNSGSSYLYAAVPDSLVSVTGSAAITVSTTGATPPLSNALAVSVVTPPAPILSSITPSSGPIGVGFAATLNGSNFTSASVVQVNGVAVPTMFADSTQLTATVPASAVSLGNLIFSATTPAPGGGTSAPLIFTSYVPVLNNSMIFNPADHLFYLSIPSAAGAPYGNSVVSLDPVTGALGTPIFVGSEPNHLALTSDGSALWVGLDGPAAVRKVDLVGHTAGLQFALPASSGTPLQAVALAAIPGQPDSVIVSSADQSSGVLAIYDAGVKRGNSVQFAGNPVLTLQIDGARNEVYGASANTFNAYGVYSYNFSGVTLSTQVTLVNPIAQSADARIQLVSGRIYSDLGSVLDAESGAFLGSFGNTYNIHTPTAVDPGSGLAFVLNNAQPYSSLPNQVQPYNLSDFSVAGTSTIPVNFRQSFSGPSLYPQDLNRWGADGLAFHTSSSVYSIRSSIVKDLSTSPADLSVTLTASSNASPGSQVTYTASILNNGPSAASEVSLTASIPSTGVLVSASGGYCSLNPVPICDLGTLASQASATVNLVVQQLTPGSSTLAVQVSASQADPDPSNNQASLTSTVTGSAYAPVPALTSVFPSTVLAGSPDTLITVAGSGFEAGSVIQVDGAALPTLFTSSTQIAATVPAASLAALSWHRITVSTSAPGGGVSQPLPLSVFSTIKAGANHILYEPFSRQIYATLGSDTPSGNSLQALNPDTGIFAPPVPIGSVPTRMALSDDGQIIYVLDSDANQIVRYNLINKQTEAIFAVPPAFGSDNASEVDFAVQQGSENTVAVTQFNPSLEIVDFDPIAHSATVRPGVLAGGATVFSPRFLNSSDIVVDLQGGQLDTYAVSASGVGPTPASFTDESYGPFKLANGLAFAANGGVIDVTTQPNRDLGNFDIAGSPTDAPVAPEPALGRVFFFVGYDDTGFSYSSPLGIATFDLNTFTNTGFLPLDVSTVDGNSSPVSAVDLFRFGQDGLAALSSAGTIYLLRGPGVVPSLLSTSAAPVLSAVSPAAIQHGAGNTVLTLTGTNLLPGASAFWNGSYRTTTLIDPGHVTVDVPTSDLSATGTAAIVVQNPGSTNSQSISVAVN